MMRDTIIITLTVNKKMEAQGREVAAQEHAEPVSSTAASALLL